LMMSVKLGKRQRDHLLCTFLIKITWIDHDL
jgi:hypothetical protein